MGVALQLKTEEENVKLKLPAGSGPVEVTVDMATPKDPEVVKSAVAIAVETKAKDVKGIDDFKTGGVIRVSVKPPLSVKLQIDGISFEDLAANPTLQGVFEDALVRSVALQLKT